VARHAIGSSGRTRGNASGESSIGGAVLISVGESGLHFGGGLAVLECGRWCFERAKAAKNETQLVEVQRELKERFFCTDDTPGVVVKG
jgi:hypothetical protein